MKDRFLRQMLVRGWGPAAQSRVESNAAEAKGATLLARAVARRYLLGAGVSGVEDREEPFAEGTQPPMQSERCREVLLGARSALSELRRLLGAA